MKIYLFENLNVILISTLPNKTVLKTRIKSKHKIHVITLGCSKNTVDSEKLMAQLIAHDVEIEYDVDNSDARTVIINTCGFIADAKQESINTILDYIKAKEQGLIDYVYVMGCLSERYAKDLKIEIPEVDQYFGVNDISKIIETLGYNYQQSLVGERLLSTPKHYAYLKVSEGCNRKCAFCAIPLIRGKYNSLTVPELVTEAKHLAQKGTKEIMLIAQDLSYYGKDIDKKSHLALLIEKLSEIEQIEWIRLHYAYPSAFPKEVIKLMANNPKVCKYLDIPFQHISNKMLQKMRRGNTQEQTYKLINDIRNAIPNIALRTTLLVGHPGETEKDFEQLVNFVETVKFDRLGVFPYSLEEDTYAAKNYKDSVSNKVKQQRAAHIMQIQQSISEDLNRQKTGKQYKVIIDRLEGDYYIGRTEFDSPEVDNEVLIQKHENILQIGEFYSVEIIKATEFDLYGRKS